MPDPYESGLSNLEIGENWWDLQDSSQFTGSDESAQQGAQQGYDYWSSIFNPFLNDPGNPNTSNINMDTWSSMLGFANYFTPYNIDEGEHYRAIETGNISKGILRDQFSSDKMPLMNTRIGGTGFATSGIRPVENIYDTYRQSLVEANQESQAALNTVYENFGESLYGAVESASEAGMFDFESEEYADIEGNYDFSGVEGYNEDMTFSEQIQACVEQYMSTTYLATEAQNPQFFAEAMQYCHNTYHNPGDS